MEVDEVEEDDEDKTTDEEEDKDEEEDGCRGSREQEDEKEDREGELPSPQMSSVGKLQGVNFLAPSWHRGGHEASASGRQPEDTSPPSSHVLWQRLGLR